MKQLPPLPRADLLDLKSILLRAAMNAERNNRIDHAEKLAREIAALDAELAVTR
jgi:hypothetical protein